MLPYLRKVLREWRASELRGQDVKLGLALNFTLRLSASAARRLKRGSALTEQLKLFNLVEGVDDLARFIRAEFHRLATQGIARNLRIDRIAQQSHQYRSRELR